MINEGKREITCHAELVSASHDTEIPKQVRNDMNPSPQPSPTRGEGVSSRVDFSLPEKLDCRASLAMTKVAFTLAEVFSSHFAGRRKTAFTLAEVLITLGIIGVVAAMTLPALVQHYRKVEYASRVKKFYSSMSQAILLSEAANGSPYEWNKDHTIYDEKGFYDYNANGESTNHFFMKYLAPYIKYTKIEQGKSEIDKDGNQKTSMTTVYFADGSTAWIWNGSCIDMGFDVNGKSKPNQSGRDNFRFLICPWASESLGHCGNTLKYLCDYRGWPYTDNRETLLSRCKTNAALCTGILMHDGWEFKKDYPYKL